MRLRRARVVIAFAVAALATVVFVIAVLGLAQAYADTVTVSIDGKEVNYHCSDKAVGTVCEPLGQVCGGDLKNKDCWDAVAAVAFYQEPAIPTHLMKLAGCWQPDLLTVVRAIRGRRQTPSPPTPAPESVEAYNCCALIASRYAPTFPASVTAVGSDGSIAMYERSAGPPIAPVQPMQGLKCVMPTPHPFDRYSACVRANPKMKRYQNYRFYFADFVVVETQSTKWDRAEAFQCGQDTLECAVSRKQKAVSCSLSSWPQDAPKHADDEAIAKRRISNVPDTLDRAMIAKGMNAMTDRVGRCKAGRKDVTGGYVFIIVSVRPNGTVEAVDVDDSPDANLGQCVAGVVRSAQFPATKSGGKFRHGFAF